ncbi:DUF2071 domain-containing protein [Hymenobacter psychrophilus]|uniref:Uncharacterized conserved protein (COG2071) n=1 Tax=Hymenobacter psychrophilus TaxID=651662 RepID=A0A1H3B2A5_9BACT|nr:DUF2071 domain-containing protein [Hymenobacter psychrophilus]SDX36096.1 Uncharacterized conserved protein (COG2071) [Hymenobacter psychrophilus]
MLAHHPFAVAAQISRTTVLTYAVPVAELRALVPACLQLDTLDDTWGFVAVALVQTRQLRPKGMPAFLGQDFFLIGYRVFVRYTTAAGKRLRGLYILRSETDKRRMQWLGNLFTGYHYRTIDIVYQATANGLRFASEKARLRVQVELPAGGEAELPVGSPFESWAKARRFAGPLPFTFSVDEAGQQMIIVEGVREDWHPQSVRVLEAQVGLLDELGLPGTQLASAFTMTNIPYSWKKGRAEPLPA